MPEPEAQYEYRNDEGTLITIPDFAYPDRKIAIYCDGFAYHGNADALSGDAAKRNALQADGWAVLTFWGKQILRNADRCEEQIWRCYKFRGHKADSRSGRNNGGLHSVGGGAVLDAKPSVRRASTNSAGLTP